MPTIQKISATLRKAGLKPSKTGRGRIGSRWTEGYELYKPSWPEDVARVSYSMGYHWRGDDGRDVIKRAELRAALAAAVFQFTEDGYATFEVKL